MKYNTLQYERCPFCNRIESIADDRTGEVVCTTCGFVKSERGIERDSDQFTYVNQTGKAGRGSLNRNPTSNDLSTSLDGNYDVTGAKVSTDMRRLDKLNRTAHNTSETTKLSKRIKSNQLLGSIKSELGLTDYVIDESMRILEKVTQDNVAAGSRIDHMTYASLYAACRKLAIPRTLAEICKVGGTRKRGVNTCYRRICRHYDFKMPVISPILFVSRIIESISIDGVVERKSHDIIRSLIDTKHTCGKDPSILAGIAILIAADQTGVSKQYKRGVLRRRVREALGCCDVSIRTGLRQVSEVLTYID